MQLLAIALAAIIVSCTADVSHLNNGYLPPDQDDNSLHTIDIPNENIDSGTAHLSGGNIAVSIDSVQSNLQHSAPVVHQQQSAPVVHQEQSEPVVHQQHSVVLEQAAPLVSNILTRISTEEEEEESAQINLAQSDPEPLSLQHIVHQSIQQQPLIVHQPIQQQQPLIVQEPIQEQILVHQAIPQQLPVQQAIPQQLTVQQHVAPVQHVHVEAQQQQQQQQQQHSSGIDTQYGSNGGYIY